MSSEKIQVFQLGNKLFGNFVSVEIETFHIQKHTNYRLIQNMENNESFEKSTKMEILN